MADESLEERLARLEAENKALKEQDERKPGQLRLKVSEKGGITRAAIDSEYYTGIYLSILESYSNPF